MVKMICYPQADTVTPLIVAGPQRSGTRFVTNVLNSVPEVTIQDEIRDSVMLSLVNLAKTCDKVYSLSHRKSRSENWDFTKRDFMFAAWANLTQGKRKKITSDCLFYGYKTPFHEMYFDFYNAFFAPIRPKYVCCVRLFIDNYLSVHARWPEKSIVSVAKKYVQSLRQLRYMKETRPDDVFFFFLDDYKKIGFQYLRERIFDPLGLSDLVAAKRKAEQGPANASVQKGVQKRNQLNRMQMLLLKIYPHALQAYDSLHRDFG